METAVHRNEKEDRLYIYVEGYVLPYLQEELQKEEVLRIYLYGRRAVNRYEIYGAGHEREIAQFSGYTLLEELECRTEAAELVFLLTQKEKRIEIKSYEVFYQRNEGMQNYLLETQKADKSNRTSDLPERKEEKRLEEKKRMQSGGWFTVQLTALFLLLTAIVITSTDSYDKLSQLGKSAKDVMFMVENRAAQPESEQKPSASAEQRSEAFAEQTGEETAGQPESEQRSEASAEQTGEETVGQPESEQRSEASAEQTGEETAGQPESEQRSEASAEQTGEETVGEPESEQKSGASEEQMGEETSGEPESEQKSGVSEEQTEAEEALSRSLTRYYEVKKGDTLYTICREVYGDLSKVKKVCELNHIENPDEIGYGQRLILP